MSIKPISKKDKERFNKSTAHPLQSWKWGEFRKVWGNRVVRLPFGQVVFSKIPYTRFTIGTFIKGPKPTKKMLLDLKKLAKEENAIFIKLEPNVVVNAKVKSQNSKLQAKSKKEIIKLLKSNNCVLGKTLFTPTSFWIDLTKSEDELMKSFSNKTRYNIRLAKRKGVVVSENNSDKAFEKYVELMRETVERQGFYAHSEKYHRLMWKYLHQDIVTRKEKLSEPDGSPSRRPIARLLTAKYKNEIITTWIVFVWHDFLYYPYGASTDKHKNVMANNLMMWEAIRLGKKYGLKTFDLWGREEGKGFTKFKEGYNPQVVEFLGTWDLITSHLYWPYRAAEHFRWNLLRFKNKFSKPKF